MSGQEIFRSINLGIDKADYESPLMQSIVDDFKLKIEHASSFYYDEVIIDRLINDFISKIRENKIDSILK